MKMQTTRLPQGVPFNYRDLYNQHRSRLLDAAEGLGIPCHELMQRLKARRLLEDFRPAQYVPDTFSHEEARAYLGLSVVDWRGLLRKMQRPLRGGTRTFPWAEYRPNTVNDAEFFQPEAVFWGPDIHTLAQEMGDEYKMSERPVCARMASAFRRRLSQILGIVTKGEKPVEPKLKHIDGPAPLTPSLDTWPETLPRDNDALVRMYGPYVYDCLRRSSKIKTDEELREITQQVWFNLFNGKVLERFLTAATTKLPRTLTLDETLNYLGVTEGQWANAWRYHAKKKSYWMPDPVQGKPLAEDSLYLTSDVITLDESGFLKGRRVRPRKGPKITGRGFKSYLMTSARNHWLNLCRTRRRRHQERPQEANLVLAPSSAGTYHKAKVREEAFSWEDSLTENEPAMEDMMDLARQLRRHEVDPHSEQGLFVLDSMTRGTPLKDALRLFGRAQMRQKAITLHSSSMELPS